MQVNPIGANGYQINRTNRINQPLMAKNMSFQRRHETAKVLGTVAAGLGTIGAVVGTAIMTGGVSLIPTLIYGGLCGGIGAVGGHMIDKSQPDYHKKH